MSGKAESSSKTLILEAALEIISERGIQALTMDMVAERSGFSKGGVLYNFRTKEILTKAMIEMVVARINEQIQAYTDSHPACPYPTLMAMAELAEDWIENEIDSVKAVLLTHVSQPELCEPILTHKKETKERILQEVGNITRAMLLWQAIEGMLLCRAHGVEGHSREERKAMLEELKSLINGGFISKD